MFSRSIYDYEPRYELKRLTHNADNPSLSAFPAFPTNFSRTRTLPTLTMEQWSASDVTNLAGIYTILFCMVGVCYMMCDPIGGFKQPPKRSPEEELASTQTAQARAQANAQAAQ